MAPRESERPCQDYPQ